MRLVIVLASVLSGKCTPVRQSCDREVHKFESKAPTLTGDRKCSECYDCPAGTRTDSELGTACATSKRDCKACDGEKEYVDYIVYIQLHITCDLVSLASG